MKDLQRTMYAKYNDSAKRPGGYVKRNRKSAHMTIKVGDISNYEDKELRLPRTLLRAPSVFVHVDHALGEFGEHPTSLLSSTPPLSCKIAEFAMWANSTPTEER